MTTTTRTTSRNEFRYVVSGVDGAGVPWEIAYCATPVDALAALDSLDRNPRPTRGVHYMAWDEQDPEAGYFYDLDSEQVERWLAERDDEEIAGLAARFGVQVEGRRDALDALYDVFYGARTSEARRIMFARYGFSPGPEAAALVARELPLMRSVEARQAAWRGPIQWVIDKAVAAGQLPRGAKGER